MSELDESISNGSKQTSSDTGYNRRSSLTGQNDYALSPPPGGRSIFGPPKQSPSISKPRKYAATNTNKPNDTKGRQLSTYNSSQAIFVVVYFHHSKFGQYTFIKEGNISTINGQYANC